MATKTGIIIAKTLKSKLPDNERKDVERLLKKKAGGKCYLCAGPLNEASDRIVADHDIPEAEGGETKVSNLNLVHAECNSWKRNHPTAPAKAFLPFRRFVDHSRASLVYSDCLSFFELTPKECVLSREGKHVSIQFPDGTSTSVDVIHEERPGHKYEYCFAEVPISAIFNDAECQPRTIKPKQVWSIFSDLHKNPLHEPPSCRVLTDDGSAALMMFDGQHKTIASLLMGRTRIAIKIYVGLGSDETRHLVNSIQAKIPKLPLSAMELMAKMGMEYNDQLGSYVEQEGDSASESGFLKWLPADERRRGKQAFESACIQAVWEVDELELRKYVGESAESARRLTEATAKNKLLRPLVYVKALDMSFEASEPVRERERKLVVELLNQYVEEAFTSSSRRPTDEDEEAVRRRMYQSSLAYVASLIKKVAAHLMHIEETDSLGLETVKRSEKKLIRGAVHRITEHPVWRQPYNTERMIAVRDSLSKNQNSEKAFREVGLTLGFALAGDLDPDWSG